MSALGEFVAASSRLGLASANLDDVEGTRLAVANRIRAWEQVGGGNLAEVATMRALLAAIEAQEKVCTLELQRAMRAHPLGPWVKRTVGVGEKQAARLLAAIGDPSWNTLEDRPRRGPAEPWAFCGLHTLPADHPPIDTHATGVGGQRNVAVRRRKGQRANWSNTAKMRARLIAESCIKHAHSPYRAVYDRERAKWNDRDTSDLHKHNHALRIVAKTVLRDLWREARDFHLRDDHPRRETQVYNVGPNRPATDHGMSDTHANAVGRNPLGTDQPRIDAHAAHVGPDPRAARHVHRDAHASPAGGASSKQEAVA